MLKMVNGELVDVPDEEGGVATATETPGTPTPTPTAPTPAPAAPTTPALPSGALPSGSPSVPPPPPPPPPPPADLGAIRAAVGDFTKSWLANPNPYTSDTVAAIRAAGEGRLKKSELESKRAISEWAQQRFGSGPSSPEESAQIRLQSELDQNRRQQEADLLQMVAAAQGLGMQNAGNLGLDTLRTLEASQVSERDLDLRAQQLMTSAALEGRSLDLQEARDQAARELSQGQLEQQKLEYQGNLAQRQTEFAQSHGLDEAKFKADQDLAAKQYGEQVATRLQQDEQFKATLADTQSARSLDLGLRQRALDLQSKGMDLDSAYKQAALDQERELKTAALNLEKLGLEKEDAYRYAALAQDADFRKEANRLTELGLDMQDAFHYAELNMQKEQFQQEMNFRLSQAKSDDERFQIMMDTYNTYVGNRWSDDRVKAYLLADHGETAEQIAKRTGWTPDEIKQYWDQIKPTQQTGG